MEYIITSLRIGDQQIDCGKIGLTVCEANRIAVRELRRYYASHHLPRRLRTRRFIGPTITMSRESKTNGLEIVTVAPQQP